MTRPPILPFTEETAAQKVRAAEDGWNSCQPAKVALAYTEDSQWRYRPQFIRGHVEIEQFFSPKWEQEHAHPLIKELPAFRDNQIAVRFAYEWHNVQRQWFRSYGNENREFAPDGLMQRRIASINDHAIDETDRKFLSPQGSRPDGHP